MGANVGNAQPTRCAFGWSFIKVASSQSSSAGGHFRRTNMLPGKMPRQRVLSTSTKSTMCYDIPSRNVFLNRRCQSAQCAQLNIGIIGTDRSSYGSIERLPFRRAVVSGRRMPARDERRVAPLASELEACFEGLITKGALVPARKGLAGLRFIAQA